MRRRRIDNVECGQCVADKLPSAGCCSSREGWWCDWYADIESAVEAGSVIALVKVTYDFACQVRLRGVDVRDCRDIISTDWWNKEEVSCISHDEHFRRSSFLEFSLQCAKRVGVSPGKETLVRAFEICEKL